MNIKHQIIQAYGITIADVRDFHESIKDSLYQKAFDYLYDKWMWVNTGQKLCVIDSVENGVTFGINKTKSVILRALRDEKHPTQDVLKIVTFFESGKVKKIR